MAPQLLLIAACAAAMVSRVAMLHDSLPTRIASHFGPSGEPNGFTEIHAFFVLYGVVSGLVVGMLLLSPLLTRALPTSLINLPNREYWFAASHPERKDIALAKLASWSAWFAAGVALFLSATLELVLRANLARAPLDNTTFIALLVAFAVGSLFGLVQLTRAFRVP